LDVHLNVTASPPTTALPMVTVRISNTEPLDAVTAVSEAVPDTSVYRLLLHVTTIATFAVAELLRSNARVSYTEPEPLALTVPLPEVIALPLCIALQVEALEVA